MRAGTNAFGAAVAIVVVSATLAGCGASNTPAPAGGNDPTDVYARTARELKRCWFNADDPKLPDYVFRAEAAPGGGAAIVIRDKTGSHRAGRRALTVEFKPGGFRGTTTLVRNATMPEDVLARLEPDILRWAHGATGCAAPAPPTAEKGEGGKTKNGGEKKD